MTKSYFEKLKDPRWQKKRLEVLENGGWSCEHCGDTSSTLHVHHRQYFKGREPWEYEVGQLASLCDACHGTQHEAEDHLLLATSFVQSDGPYGRETVASLVAGYCKQGMGQPYVGDPDAYMWGEVAQALSGWHRGALTLCELQLLTERAKTDLPGLVAAMRIYLGTTHAPDGLVASESRLL